MKHLLTHEKVHTAYFANEINLVLLNPSFKSKGFININSRIIRFNYSLLHKR